MRSRGQHTRLSSPRPLQWREHLWEHRRALVSRQQHIPAPPHRREALHHGQCVKTSPTTAHILMTINNSSWGGGPGPASVTIVGKPAVASLSFPNRDTGGGDPFCFDKTRMLETNPNSDGKHRSSQHLRLCGGRALLWSADRRPALATALQTLCLQHHWKQ